MNPSPLQLERHFFTKVQVEAHREGGLAARSQLRSDIEIARDPKNVRRFEITLCLKLVPEPENKPCYTAEIHVVGLFRVVEQWPEAQVLPLVEANGPALLYGAARELLANLTARGPWPVVCLQSATFVQSQKPANPQPTSESANLPKG
jgi:preprotein translocase subunit SecB